MFCFPNTWWRYFRPPDHRSGFGHPLLAYEIIAMFYHPFFAGLEEGKVARRDASGWTQGGYFHQEDRQVSGQRPCKPPPSQMQTGKSWEWAGLISELALLPAEHLIGALMGFHPTWDIGDATSSVELAASDQSLERPGLVSSSATNSTGYPGQGNLIPMLPFSVTSALPVCPSLLIKCWTLKAGAVCSYGVSSSVAW